MTENLAMVEAVLPNWDRVGARAVEFPQEGVASMKGPALQQPEASRVWLLLNQPTHGNA